MQTRTRIVGFDVRSPPGRPSQLQSAAGSAAGRQASGEEESVEGGLVARALYAWARPAEPPAWSPASGVGLALHPPVRAWACPARRWVLFECDVESHATVGAGDGDKLRHPFFLAELPAGHAFQLLMLSCDTAAEPPRVTFAGGVQADLDDTQAILALGHRRLHATAWPDVHLAELARLAVLPLPFVARLAARATVPDGQQIWVEESCREHGPTAVQIRLAGPGEKTRTVAAETVVWSRIGMLLQVSCGLGRLTISWPPRPHTSFWCPASGLPGALAELTISLGRCGEGAAQFCGAGCAAQADIGAVRDIKAKCASISTLNSARSPRAVGLRNTTSRTATYSLLSTPDGVSPGSRRPHPTHSLGLRCGDVPRHHEP